MLLGVYNLFLFINIMLLNIKNIQKIFSEYNVLRSAGIFFDEMDQMIIYFNQLPEAQCLSSYFITSHEQMKNIPKNMIIRSLETIELSDEISKLAHNVEKLYKFMNIWLRIFPKCEIIPSSKDIKIFKIKIDDIIDNYNMTIIPKGISSKEFNVCVGKYSLAKLIEIQGYPFHEFFWLNLLDDMMQIFINCSSHDKDNFDDIPPFLRLERFLTCYTSILLGDTNMTIPGLLDGALPNFGWDNKSPLKHRCRNSKYYLICHLTDDILQKYTAIQELDNKIISFYN